jgi:ferredoxin
VTAGLRLKVDPIACDGHGLCAELLPGMVTLDDWGFPLISSQDLPAALRGDASAAVQLCPRLALRLEAPGDADGSGFAQAREIRGVQQKRADRRSPPAGSGRG